MLQAAKCSGNMNLFFKPKNLENREFKNSRNMRIFRGVFFSFIFRIILKAILGKEAVSGDIIKDTPFSTVLWNLKGDILNFWQSKKFHFRRGYMIWKLTHFYCFLAKGKEGCAWKIINFEWFWYFGKKVLLVAHS